MIRINLIASQKTKSGPDRTGSIVEAIVIFLFVGAGLLGAFFFWSSMEDRLGTAKKKVVQEQALIRGLKKARITLKEFEAKEKELERQLKIINQLHKSKRGPIRVLDQIIVRIPKRVWITTIEQRKAGRLTLTGLAEDNESVAIFLKKLEDSPYFVSVDLQQIVRRTFGGGGGKEAKQRTVFSVACKVKYSVSDT